MQSVTSQSFIAVAPAHSQAPAAATEPPSESAATFGQILTSTQQTAQQTAIALPALPALPIPPTLIAPAVTPADPLAALCGEAEAGLALPVEDGETEDPLAPEAIALATALALQIQPRPLPAEPVLDPASCDAEVTTALLATTSQVAPLSAKSSQDAPLLSRPATGLQPEIKPATVLGAGADAELEFEGAESAENARLLTESTPAVQPKSATAVSAAPNLSAGIKQTQTDPLQSSGLTDVSRFSIASSASKTQSTEQVVVEDAAQLHAHDIEYLPEGVAVRVGLAQKAAATTAQGLVGAERQSMITAGAAAKQAVPAPVFESSQPLEVTLEPIEARSVDAVSDGVGLAVQQLTPQADGAANWRAAASPLEGSESAERVAAGSRLVRAITAALPKPLSTVNIQVRPEGFGLINIRIVAPPAGQAGGEYRIEIRTADAAAHSLLTHSIAELRQNLQVDGLSVRAAPSTQGFELRDADARHGEREGAQHRQPAQDFRHEGGNRRSKQLFELLDEPGR